MNKDELINAISAKLAISRSSATETLDAILDTIMDEVTKGGKIQLVGFGSFEVKSRAARKGYNPHTCEEIIIPACQEPVFKAGKLLKEIINQ